MTNPVAPPAAPTVPVYPALGSPNFNAEAYAYGSSMPGVSAAIGSIATAAYTNAQSAFESASSASQAETTASAAAAAASAAAGATKWVSGTYAQGVVVWSPANGLLYRRKTAGSSSIDPSADNAGWWLTGSPYSMPQQELSTAGPHQLVVGRHYIILHPTADCLMPANAAPQEQLRITNRSGARTPILRRNGGKFDNVADDMQLDALQADLVLTMTTNRGWI